MLRGEGREKRARSGALGFSPATLEQGHYKSYKSRKIMLQKTGLTAEILRRLCLLRMTAKNEPTIHKPYRGYPGMPT